MCHEILKPVIYKLDILCVILWFAWICGLGEFVVSVVRLNRLFIDFNSISGMQFLFWVHELDLFSE